jgi:gamma-glutamyltranspeptidase / glutathione hydrolase
VRHSTRVGFFVCLGWAAASLAHTDQSARIESARPAVVAAAHPLAAEAGMRVLRAGGTAIDAAVAVQATLGLVEPQSSGLGGGAFLLHYDAASRRIDVYDGRETAPASATAGMFLDPSGRALTRAEAMVSGRATGVPGVVAMLRLAHVEHGFSRWESLFEFAAAQADAGFEVGGRLARHVHGRFPQASVPDVQQYFRRSDGSLLREGDRLRNPEYAAFLRRLATEGPDALYRGDTARAIVRRATEPPLPGVITTTDIEAYRPIKRSPLCRRYRRYQLCSAPPPSSGVGLLHLMAVLETTDIRRRGPSDAIAWYRFAEASRLMYADRDAWVGDPDFVTVPTSGLLQAAYVRRRAALIGDRATPVRTAGRPTGAPPAVVDTTREPEGTSHFVIVDARGNAVSMTTTIESYFGSGRMVAGFFLNNQLTDFSFSPDGPNAIAPGKRPRSSMAPVLILDRDGSLLGAIGSPGGNAIPAYVAKAIVGVLDWNLSMQAAVDLPNIIGREARWNGESHRLPANVVQGLAARGIVVRPGSGEDSGIHGVLWRRGRWDGGADSRREGVVLIDDSGAVDSATAVVFKGAGR